MELIKNERFILTKESLTEVIKLLNEHNYIYYEYNDCGEIQGGSTQELFLEQVYQNELESIKANLLIHLEKLLENILNAEVLITPTNDGALIDIDNQNGVHVVIVAGERE